MKQNYWKSISVTFLISIAFALFGCQKGAIDGKSEETSTSNTDAQEHHVAQESLVDNDGKIQTVDQLTATLSGIAIDDLGMPVEDATVSAFGESTKTNIGGSWKLENVPVSQVITQAALDGVSNDNGVVNGNQNNTIASVPVSVVKDGYSSAVVYVGTTAVVTESNASINDGGANNETSNSQPNTLVLTGLVGTSGDVVLKKNTSTIFGYLRNAVNGNAVSGVSLSIVPDRGGDGLGVIEDTEAANNGNIGATGATEHKPGSVVYGYKAKDVTTGSDGSFTVSGLTAATSYTIVINQPGLIAVDEPADADLSGDAGDKNNDAVGPGTIAGGGEVENGDPGHNPANTGDQRDQDEDNAQDDVNRQWKFNMLTNSTLTLGNLWVNEVNVTDNVNPFVTWIDNAFELSFNDDDDTFVQLDDTVDFVNVPLVIHFSENMNSDRVNGQFEGEHPEYTGTGGGKAVPVLVYIRDYESLKNADGLNIDNCYSYAGHEDPDATCVDKRLYVDEDKTKLEGNKLTLYLESIPKTSPLIQNKIIDILLKETDFRDMSGNHLSTIPNDREDITPDLFHAANKKAPENLATLVNEADIVQDTNYRNYWEFSFKIYSEPDLSVPEPVREIKRPVAAQLTCGDATYVGAEEADIIKLKKDADGNINQFTDKAYEEIERVIQISGRNVNFNFANNKVVQTLGEVGNDDDLKARLSGLCDYDTDTPEIITQYNADVVALQENGEGKSRLEVLAQEYAEKEADFADWEASTVVTNVAIVRLTGDVEKGVEYKVTASYKDSKGNNLAINPSLVAVDTAEQMAIVTDSQGLTADPETNKSYYVGLVDVDDQTKGFTFLGSGAGQNLRMVGLPVGTTLTISPIKVEEGAEKDTFVETEKGRVLTIEDLTPPMVAIQSENWFDKLEKTQPGIDIAGIDDVPGEVLIEGETAEAGKYYPGLRLTASLYDRTTRRGGDVVDNDQPLLDVPGATSPSAQYYSSGDYNLWVAGNRYNKVQFAGPVRDVIIEMTEEMEADLKYCKGDATYPNTGAGEDEDDKDVRCGLIEPANAKVEGIRNGGIFGNGILGNKVDTVDDDFIDVNGDVDGQLDALRSYDSNNSYLVATLQDWREVDKNDKNRGTLLTFVGLRDKNKNEIVKKDVGVIFLDRTPPLANQFNITANESVQIVFDQPIKAVEGGELVVYGEGNTVYTFKFIDDENAGNGTATTRATVSGVDYTDYMGKNVKSSDEIPVTVTVNDSTLNLELTSAVDGDPHFGVNMMAYFAPVSTENDADVSVLYDDIADTTRDQNTWAEVTRLANQGSTIAEQNDAYYCNPNATTDPCVAPELMLTNDNAADGKSAATLAYLGPVTNEICVGLGISTISGETQAVGNSCARVDPDISGTVRNDVYLNVVHENTTHHINSLLPNYVNAGEAGTSDNVWSAGDGAQIEDVVIVGTQQDKKIMWGTVEDNEADADESYVIKMTFRENIVCDTASDTISEANVAANSAKDKAKEVYADDNETQNAIGNLLDAVLASSNVTKQNVVAALESYPDVKTAAEEAKRTICEAEITNAGNTLVSSYNSDGSVKVERTYKHHPAVSSSGNVLTISFERNESHIVKGACPLSARFKPDIIELDSDDVQDLMDSELFDGLENNLNSLKKVYGSPNYTEDLEAAINEDGNFTDDQKTMIIAKATKAGTIWSCKANGDEYMADGRAGRHELTDADITSLVTDEWSDNAKDDLEALKEITDKDDLETAVEASGNLSEVQKNNVLAKANKSDFISQNLNMNMYKNGDMITIYNVRDKGYNQFDKITLELLDTDHGVEIRAYKGGSLNLVDSITGIKRARYTGSSEVSLAK